MYYKENSMGVFCKLLFDIIYTRKEYSPKYFLGNLYRKVEVCVAMGKYQNRQSPAPLERWAELAKLPAFEARGSLFALLSCLAHSAAAHGRLLYSK